MAALARLREAQGLVTKAVTPTPCHCWPLLCSRTGAEVWVKHENHTATGAFKMRGGLIYLERLGKRSGNPKGVIAATRGNHGQSVAFAAARARLPTTIVVPHGNSIEKNAAMRALGASLIEAGHDFQAALEFAQNHARNNDLHMLPSFHDDLVDGVASYGLELFDRHDDLDAVYVPIGLGSGICATLRARDALSLSTSIVGVVAENAPTYARSFAKGKPVSTSSADTVADGMACRVPNRDALREIAAGVERIVTVSDDQIRDAMRFYFSDTHNVAEGAGAAPLAALIKERKAMAGRKVALILSGGNVDRDIFAGILADG